MMVSESQQKAVNKYIKKNYIQINVKVRKDKGLLYKEYFKQHPEIKLNKTIEKCLDDLLMQDKEFSIKLADLNQNKE